MAKRGERTHFTLFVPGVGRDAADWRRLLAKQGVTLTRGVLRAETLGFKVQWECIANDGTFGEAFTFGTTSEEEQAAIGRAPSALVLYFPVDLHTERAAVAKLGGKLARAGALAIRIEESKLGWPVAKWVQMVKGDDPWSLHRAAVVVLDGNRGRLTQSCGMQVFSLPDAAIAATGDRATAQELLSTFNVYQIAEAPLMLSGQTFSPDRETPRRRFVRWPDARYPASHSCHNPFGVWRLGRQGSKATPQSKLALTFIPSLVSVLSSQELRLRRRLSRAQVKYIAKNGTVMALPHDQARALEWDRGYADIDPELAWEQWQIARRGRSL